MSTERSKSKNAGRPLPVVPDLSAKAVEQRNDKARVLSSVVNTRDLMKVSTGIPRLHIENEDSKSIDASTIAVGTEKIQTGAAPAEQVPHGTGEKWLVNTGSSPRKKDPPEISNWPIVLTQVTSQPEQVKLISRIDQSKAENPSKSPTRDSKRTPPASLLRQVAKYGELRPSAIQFLDLTVDNNSARHEKTSSRNSAIDSQTRQPHEIESPKSPKKEDPTEFRRHRVADKTLIRRNRPRTFSIRQHVKSTPPSGHTPQDLAFESAIPSDSLPLNPAHGQNITESGPPANVPPLNPDLQKLNDFVLALSADLSDFITEESTPVETGISENASAIPPGRTSRARYPSQELKVNPRIQKAYDKKHSRDSSTKSENFDALPTVTNLTTISKNNLDDGKLNPIDEKSDDLSISIITSNRTDAT